MRRGVRKPSAYADFTREDALLTGSITSAASPDARGGGDTEVTNTSVATATYRNHSQQTTFHGNSSSFLANSACEAKSGVCEQDEKRSADNNDSTKSPTCVERERIGRERGPRRPPNLRLQLPALQSSSAAPHQQPFRSERAPFDHDTVDSMSSTSSDPSDEDFTSENDLLGSGMHPDNMNVAGNDYVCGNVKRRGGGGGAVAEDATVGLDNISTVRALNNYEQGLVLVLVHLMRSLANEYLRSYVFYHELMEDLDDLGSMRCSRHQRLEILRRMSHTHHFLR